jgi:hypothetical protein
MPGPSRTHEPEATYYGPSSKCERHWTRKTSTAEPGICRFCLVKLKTKLELSSRAIQPTD